MVKKLISVLLALVLCGALFPAAAEDASPDGTEDIIAKMPEPGWVLDSVNGAIWQDDRASLEVFLEDVDNYKVDINWDEETLDGGDHLNLSGAQKTTAFVGDWLSSTFELEDHRVDASYQRWQDLYESYRTKLEDLG